MNIDLSKKLLKRIGSDWFKGLSPKATKELKGKFKLAALNAKRKFTALEAKEAADEYYEALEREHLGDPELKTGIYHPHNHIGDQPECECPEPHCGTDDSCKAYNAYTDPASPFAPDHVVNEPFVHVPATEHLIGSGQRENHVATCTCLACKPLSAPFE